ncbi:hypothetical protein Mycsm_01618 [Mycobacterium sp. JS623]|uniref:hypothetical protein n=1 Tax=Mycobacterium sp. JS623 TaxID=212767 RepID=UPI0002A59887|nr:hypothetical protein [Mycobacterium sp. JS623]AGB22017.1 hypothetical protein Mycsm_01618 [Mycobacterium sp. JS623]
MTITLDTAITVSSPSLSSRITARVGARHLDRLLVTGARPEPGSALDVHIMRLCSFAYREQLAAELRRRGTAMLCDRVVLTPSRLNAAAVSDAADMIERVEQRLLNRHVSPRGVARLRRLLADWNGPVRRGCGDLCGELRAVLAAL